MASSETECCMAKESSDIQRSSNEGKHNMNDIPDDRFKECLHKSKRDFPKNGLEEVEVVCQRIQASCPTSNSDYMAIKCKKVHDQHVENAKVCEFFLKGKCRFGDKCFNYHDIYATKDNTKHWQSSKCYRSSNSGNLKIEEGKPSEKKVAMKTATHVINRIQWDTKLNPDDFTVGYLDRFIGIVESAFSSFDWEDITSQDLSQLAIPKHRIQYFKFFDTVVWDKTKRIDLMFGSTGSGQTILDMIQGKDEDEQ